MRAALGSDDWVSSDDEVEGANRSSEEVGCGDDSSRCHDRMFLLFLSCGSPIAHVISQWSKSTELEHGA